MFSSDLAMTWQYVEKWARLQPEGEAFVFGGQRMTWRKAAAQVDAIAKGLLELGVQPGDRVAMISMARCEFPTLFMATNKVRATWLGLSPKLSVDELRYMLEDCTPKVLVTLTDYLGKDLVEAGETMVRELDCLEAIFVIGESVEGARSYREFVEKDRPHLDGALARRAAEGRPDDISLLMYTSGSTGKPKGVLHTHRSIIANIAEEVRQFGLAPGKRTLIHFPINHVAADVELGFASIYGGATTVMMDRFDPVASLDTIERERITLVGQVPSMFLLQFHTDRFRDMNWEAVELFVWSGSTAPIEMVETLRAIAKRTGARLLNGYGSTELTGIVTYTQPEDSFDDLCRTVGRVVSPFELRIVDADRVDVADGVVGEMAVRGPNVMVGYLNRPEATAQVLDSEGWYYTGDLAWRDERGYAYITGRKSEMYKSGGENVHPREVEDVIEKHPAIMQVAVLGVPDPVYQEVGKAFVVAKPAHHVTEHELRAHCKQHLANYKAPKHYEFREALPLLPNGKVNKLALKNA